MVVKRTKLYASGYGREQMQYCAQVVLVNESMYSTRTSTKSTGVNQSDSLHCFRTFSYEKPLH